jgi:pyridinium-3,5-bisthiocarboxylic acid mononucleotide nickel chelatase
LQYNHLKRSLLVIETNIDDMNPEFYNDVSGKLFALGSVDVSLVPVRMKKNRPGVLLRALVEPSMETAAAEIILSETTTLGIRVLGSEGSSLRAKRRRFQRFSARAK